MDLTKKWKIASLFCLILSVALDNSIPFANTLGNLIQLDSKSEKELNDEKDFQKQTAKYNKNYKDTK